MLEEEARVAQWRVVWAGAIALLRTVGDVLDKIDGTNVDVRKASNARYEA
jgi:hypothetical protein